MEAVAEAHVVKCELFARALLPYDWQRLLSIHNSSLVAWANAASSSSAGAW